MNPFILKGYKGPKYFCDRKEETNKIQTALQNGQDITLYGYRRLGKSALIKHIFDNLKKDYTCIYVDIWGTTSIEDFTKTLINSTIKSKVLSKKNLKTKLFDLLKSIGASFSIGADGMPAVDIIYKDRNSEFSGIEELFSFITSLKLPIIMAIDEFQEIRTYDNNSPFEAKLRTLIQSADNINFIFSGSEKHLLSDIFTSHKMPFYQSTRMLSIDKIDEGSYIEFINDHFKAAKKELNTKIIEFIFEKSYLHTYYTQAMLNLLYSIPKKKVELDEFERVFRDFILEKSAYYSELPELLTKQQFMLIKAIGKSGLVNSPTSSDFLTSSGIKSSSSMNRLINSLNEKQLILKEKDSYRLYDVFLENFIKYTN